MIITHAIAAVKTEAGTSEVISNQLIGAQRDERELIQ